MSGLERARRLPVFVDEDQWARAYAAARYEVAVLEGQGLLLPQTAESRTTIATRIATAALRAAAQDLDGDVADLPGVHIDEVGSNHTRKPASETVITSPLPTEEIRYRGDITL